MSHFTVMVIGKNPEKQLKPYDENLTVTRYVRFTKEQLIANGKSEIEQYKNDVYNEFLTNKEEYIKKYSHNEGHIFYLENTFPRKLDWTDEEIYADMIKYYDETDIGLNGEIYSTYNPNSKWDWYQLGGRWSGLIKLKDGVNGKVGSGSLVMQNEAGIDQAKKGNIDNLNELSTFAILKDGKWYEQSEMGYFGMTYNEKMSQDEWKNFQKDMINSLPDDTLISIYDCHI